MNALQKIEKLRLKKGWSLYKLAEESGLPQSTLSNMYARKTLPSLSTLNSICIALNISLSEFFSDNLTEINNAEINKLLKNYFLLSEKEKKAVQSLIQILVKN